MNSNDGDKKEKKTFLFKWDYSYYNLSDLVKEYDKKSDSGRYVECGYGRKLVYSEKNEQLLRETSPSSELDINSDIFIYFYNIPGSSNQIYLKLEDLEFKDDKGNLTFSYEIEEKDDITGKRKIVQYVQRCVHAKTVKWIFDENNILRFTKEGLIDKNIEERPSVQRIDDTTNNNLVKELNDCCYSYSSIKDKMSKFGECYFKKHNFNDDPSTYHVTFNNKFDLPYLEQHHFILQEIYKNYDGDKKEELYDKIYNNHNIVLLCPRCHRMIHQANEETRKKMINKIMQDKEYLKNLESASKFLGKSKEQLIEDMYYKEFKN